MAKRPTPTAQQVSSGDRHLNFYETQVARELGLHEGTLGRWVNLDRRAREGEGPLSENERDELNRLRKENAELVTERDVLKRSAALWLSG